VECGILSEQDTTIKDRRRKAIKSLRSPSKTKPVTLEKKNVFPLKTFFLLFFLFGSSCQPKQQKRALEVKSDWRSIKGATFKKRLLPHFEFQPRKKKKEKEKKCFQKSRWTSKKDSQPNSFVE